MPIFRHYLLSHCTVGTISFAKYCDFVFSNRITNKLSFNAVHVYLWFSKCGANHAHKREWKIFVEC